MKKRNKQIQRVPSYAFGTEQIGNIITGLGSLSGALPIGTSQATSVRLANALTATDIAQGVSGGASIGSAFGPVGTIIGAGAGLIGGAIGRSGTTIQTPGFTEDDVHTRSTGLKALFGGRKRDNRRIRRSRENVNANRASVTGTANLQTDYYLDNPYEGYALANGGQLPSSMAYVDDGELINTPTGMLEVPENNQPTDSNLISLPMGSTVLSDKLKVPGSKKTFAEIGKQMMSKKISKGNSKIAEDTNMLNERSDQNIYDQLYTLQEMTKQEKGIQPRQKAIPSYALGTDGDGWLSRLLSGRSAVGNDTVNTGQISRNTARNPIQRTLPVYREDLNTFPTERDNYFDTLNARPAAQQPQTVRQFAPIEEESVEPQVVSSPRRSASTRRRQAPAAAFTELIPPEPVEARFMPVVPNAGVTSRLPSATDVTRLEPITSTDVNPTTSTPSNADGSVGQISRGTVNFSNILSQIGSLAPAISNLFPGDPEYIRPEYNPYAQPILNTMRQRRFNSRPIVEELGRQRSIGNYNINLMNTNTGANLAARTQLANNYANQVSGVMANEQNINNDYMALYADTMNNIGQQYVSANNIATDYNNRSRAQNRNIRRAGISQLSEWLQVQDRNRNLRNRDDAYLAAYAPLLEGAYTQDTYNELLRSLRR